MVFETQQPTADAWQRRRSTGPARAGRRRMATGLIAAALVAITGVASAADDDAFAAALYEKAKAAGEDKVAYYTSMVPAQFRNVQAAWSARYPEIAIEHIRADLGQTLERVLAENRAGRHLADVISNNEASFAVMQKSDLLAKFESPTHERWREPLKSNFNGYQFPSRVLQIGLAINTNSIKDGERPKTWKDLTAPRWKSRIGIPDPRVGGGAQLWFMTFWDRPGYGEEYLKAIAANDPLVKPGIVQMQQAAELGEVDIDVVAYDYVTLPARDAGKPLDFVLPTDGTILMPTFDSVAANAPHPNAARLFVHFLMSKPAQEAMTKAYVSPVLRDVAPNPRAPDPKDSEVLATGPTPEQVASLKEYVERMNRVLNLR
ncbi:MAG: extracellular solute-binding protein [Burkholderiaceae bacterium]